MEKVVQEEMEDHVNRHVKFFAAVKEIPRTLDIKIISNIQSMANSDDFLDNIVQSTSGLEQTRAIGKLRAEIQETINHRLNEIIDFIKNQKSLQEQERIKDLITKIKIF
jgi:hypothetical protein